MDQLGLAVLEESWIQILRKHLDMAGCWNRFWTEDKVEDFREKGFLGDIHLKLLGP